MKLEAGQALGVHLTLGGEARRVGRLAWRDRRAWFSYDEAFLATGLSLSPLRLPPRQGLLEGPARPFDGLFGLFADSLPDAWGLLLQDRLAAAREVGPLTPVDRLACVGRTALGALRYEPELLDAQREEEVQLDALAAASARVLDGGADDVLPALVRLGGSPQGARPKVLVWLRPRDQHVSSGSAAPSAEHLPVLVKFRARADTEEAGAIEHAYHQLAERAGVVVPRAWLLDSAAGAGWFAVERFDRGWHCHTLAGLLHADHRLPSLDYVGGLAAVHRLCRDQRAVEQLFRRMVFNVVAHNRDDHTKQVTLRMDAAGGWSLAPAYDLTPARGPGGEHSMAVAGRGIPDRAAVLEVARLAGVRSPAAVVEEVVEAVFAGWPEVAPSAAAREQVGRRLIRL